MRWQGYDAAAQTREACDYLRQRSPGGKPFLLFLAWGPPHDPYFTAPQKYRDLYDPRKLKLRPNVPSALEGEVRKILAGYYAHCTALDDCLGDLLRTLKETGVEKDTILLFSADHGDMLGSQGLFKKQKPFDESIRVPLLVRWPGGLGAAGRTFTAPINSEDIMPTLLGLCGMPIPKSVEGIDYSRSLRGGPSVGDHATVITCVAPFGEWERRVGGKEYRGVRTDRYTYVRDLQGPWLLFDNQTDPFQTNNLANLPAQAALQSDAGFVALEKIEGTRRRIPTGTRLHCQVGLRGECQWNRALYAVVQIDETPTPERPPTVPHFPVRIRVSFRGGAGCLGGFDFRGMPIARGSRRKRGAATAQFYFYPDRRPAIRRDGLRGKSMDSNPEHRSAGGRAFDSGTIL